MKENNNPTFASLIHMVWQRLDSLTGTNDISFPSIEVCAQRIMKPLHERSESSSTSTFLFSLDLWMVFRREKENVEAEGVEEVVGERE